MWNLGEPEPSSETLIWIMWNLCGTGAFLSAEPFFGTSGNLLKGNLYARNRGEAGARFPAAAPNHAEVFLEG